MREQKNRAYASNGEPLFTCCDIDMGYLNGQNMADKSFARWMIQRIDYLQIPPEMLTLREAFVRPVERTARAGREKGAAP